MVENNDAKDEGVSHHGSNSWQSVSLLSQLIPGWALHLLGGSVKVNQYHTSEGNPFEIWHWWLCHILPIKPNSCFILCSCENGHMYPYVGAWNQGWNQGQCQPAVCIPHHLIAAPKRTGRTNVLFADTAIRLQQQLCWSLVLDSMHYGKTTQLLTISIPITWQLTYLQKPDLLAGKRQQQNQLINGVTYKLKYNQSLVYYISLPDGKSQQN